jgi:hypothetical protein
MSALSDIVSKLAAPAAEAVTRAAAEFGDDAVQSLVKATPAMRKRIAALAERQAKRAINKANDKTLLQQLDYEKRNLVTDGPLTDIRRRVAKENSSKAAEALNRMFDSGVTPDSSVTQVGPLIQGDWGTLKQPKYVLDSLSAANKAQKVDDLAALKQLEDDVTYWRTPGWGNDPEMEALAAGAQKDYTDAVLGLATKGEIPKEMTAYLRALQNRGSGLSAIDEGLKRSFDLGVDYALPNIAPAIDQARMLSILRMIGDAQ